MKTLRSYVSGEWYVATEGYVPLVNPSTEEEIARVSSAGLDTAAALEHALTTGGPALRAMTFAERGTMLKEVMKALRQHRDELLELSRDNNGTTKPDGSFDVDGATGTLYFYSGLGQSLGDRKFLPEGDGMQLGKSEGFWGHHTLVPRRGVAVAINAFNFPAWGLFEKAACAWLAGVPMIAKPATATAVTAERAAEIVVQSGLVPEGAFQIICGGTGDLLDRLGPLDVLAFTGSADTAAKLRDRDNIRNLNTRVNVEADSLNAAVLAPDVASQKGPAYDLFVKDVVREMTQKAGQKCTAVRRIFVPEDAIDQVQKDLAAKLDEVVVGNPAEEGVTMGPVASKQQLKDCERGVEELLKQGVRVVHGPGQRRDGHGAPKGKGYFFPPTLLRADDPDASKIVHTREIFGPVATLMPYDGRAERAGELVALGGGTLVTSVYGNGASWLHVFTSIAGSWTGRIYIGSEGSSGVALGSGIAMPASLHGGPGRAGGGEELGGMVGLKRYLQRVALQGDRSLVEGLAGVGGGEED